MQIKDVATIAIIIANFNGDKYLRGCLQSLGRQSRRDFRVIVVDNGSTDGSVEQVRDYMPQAELVRNNKNLGFAKANNQGIQVAMKDPTLKYVVTLNNDTIVAEDWLENLIAVAEADPSAGAVASKVYKLHSSGIIDSVGDFVQRGTIRVVNRGAEEFDKGQYDTRGEVFSVSAVAALYRRDALEGVRVKNEYFDEDFWSYIEDVDLCVRMRLQTWKCIYAPTAIVYHAGSSTSLRLSSTLKYFLSVRNKILMCVKDLPYYYLLFLFTTYYRLLLRRYLLWSHLENGKKPQITLLTATWVSIRAACSSFFLIPRMLEKRAIISSNTRVTHEEIRRWFHTFSISP